MTRALRIVVADDEPDVRNCFQRILSHLGHEVAATATNGRELVEKCREKNPDLIITDIRMPEMNGDMAVQEICSARPTPFILISAHSELSTLDGVGSVGQTSLTKPVKRDDLKEAIGKVCPASANLDQFWDQCIEILIPHPDGASAMSYIHMGKAGQIAAELQKKTVSKLVGPVEKVQFAGRRFASFPGFVKLAAGENWCFSTGPVDA